MSAGIAGHCPVCTAASYALRDGRNFFLRVCAPGSFFVLPVMIRHLIMYFDILSDGPADWPRFSHTSRSGRLYRPPVALSYTVSSIGKQFIRLTATHEELAPLR
jgi:hypothetical protein